MNKREDWMLAGYRRPETVLALSVGLLTLGAITLCQTSRALWKLLR